MSNHNHFCLINNGILTEINRKEERLRSNPSYYLDFCKMKQRALQREAAKHSVSIELEGVYNTTSKDRILKSREQKRCERCLFEALDWGLQNYPKKLSEYFIRHTGVLVDPTQNSEGFRNTRVRILGAKVSPPAPEKLKRELSMFLIENDSLKNPIEKALHSHLHLARIHPFLDGNGRTSRLIQNIILEDGKHFPIIIRKSDREEYLELIDNAIYSRWIAETDLHSHKNGEYSKAKDKFSEGNLTPKEKKYYSGIVLKAYGELMTHEQSEFYNFLALKIRDVLQRETEKIYFHSRKNSNPNGKF